MDHLRQLDTDIYCITNKEHIFGTSELTYYDKNLELEDQKSIKNYNIVEDPYIYINSSNYIIFDALCEYTGIHYHCIEILIRNNNKLEKWQHSAHGDGTLCYPTYLNFLVSRLKYYEKNFPNIPIYIHEGIIAEPQTFHNKKSCKNYRSHKYSCEILDKQNRCMEPKSIRNVKNEMSEIKYVEFIDKLVISTITF